MARPFLFLFLACLSLSYGQDWDARNYPNPSTSGAAQCNMRSASNLCDPDQILTESQRYRLNSEMLQLEARTRQEHGRNYCEKKGITGAVALARKISGGAQAVQVMANELLKKWNFDRQCQKSIVILISVDDRRVHIARGPKVPVYGSELSQIADAQKDLYRQGDYSQALQNILQAIWETSLSKQGPGTGGAAPGPAPAPRGRDRDRGGRVSPQGGGGMGTGTIVLIVVIGLIALCLLCCCGCIYFLFFKKGGGNRRQGPSDMDGEGGRPMDGQGGGRGGGLGGLLGGLGGGAAASSIMNMIRNRGGGGRGARGGDVPPSGPAQPPAPYPDDGKPQPGLYPNVPKEDQGGGAACIRAKRYGCYWGRRRKRYGCYYTYSTSG